MIKKIFTLLCFVSLVKITEGQSIQKEGLANFISSMDKKGYQRFTWFKDSIIIFEVYEYYSMYSADNLISEGCRVDHYSILDLRNMKAQDYLSFLDTAKPLTHYVLKDGESASWVFYSSHEPYDEYIDSLIPISDTTIDGNHFKRLWFGISGKGPYNKITYFLSCSGVENIFHLSKAVDDRYPGCKVVYVQYEEPGSGRNALNKLLFIRDTLAGNEIKVFEAWLTNLNTSALPVTTHQEAMQHLTKFRKPIPGASDY